MGEGGELIWSGIVLGRETSSWEIRRLGVPIVCGPVIGFGRSEILVSVRG